MTLNKMKDQVESYKNYIVELSKRNTLALRTYKSFNTLHKKIASAHILGVDFGVGELITPKEITHLLIYEYLILSEGIFSRQIDFICFFLIKSGLKFEIKERGRLKNIKTRQQIQKTFLRQKLMFLNNNGLKLFPKYFDCNLRNAIAHIDFEIDKDGNIIYDEKMITLKELEERNGNLLDLIVCIHESYKRYNDEYIRNIPDYSE